MSMQAFVGGRVVTPAGIFAPGAVFVEAGRIVAVGPLDTTAVPVQAEYFDCAGYWVVPGFIDLHIHGLLGYDCMGAGVADVARHLPAYGVTAFLATTLTQPAAEIMASLEAMAIALDEPIDGATCLGIHLEGPFLSPARAGMAAAKWFEEFTWEHFCRYQEAARGLIRMVTLAPERGNTVAYIPLLASSGVVPALGHSDATFDQVVEAVRAGLNHATHTFNAMRPLHHREPGAVGAVLALDEITAQLIADGVHVHPAVMRILLRLKGPERVALVSDAAPVAALPDGQYTWRQRAVFVRDGSCRLADGTLAGAHALLDTGLRNLVWQVGLPLEQAIVTVASTPARVLCVQKGKLAPGYDADIVWLDADLRPVRTFVRGREVWRR